MPSTATIPATTTLGGYETTIADSPGQVRRAQRLRHQVFARELGARLPGSVDADAFDEHCDHLLVTHAPTDEVVGTYRLLPPGRTQRLYSDGEFDLTALDDLRPALVEAGRSCVHPAHRSGAAITAMWGTLARYVRLTGHRYLAGCASVPLADGGQQAAATWQVVSTHLSPPDLRVHPHRPWSPVPVEGNPGRAVLPPLLRGYLRLGAWVCGPPAHDPDFGVADFFVLLHLDRIDRRYLRYFLGDEA
jgi:putative hemolysin